MGKFPEFLKSLKTITRVEKSITMRLVGPILIGCLFVSTHAWMIRLPRFHVPEFRFPSFRILRHCGHPVETHEPIPMKTREVKGHLPNGGFFHMISSYGSSMPKKAGQVWK